MSSVRLTGIPMDHVQAELVAFPLSSEAAFDLGASGLAADLGGDTGALWRAAENELLAHFPGYSLDEIVALRDRLWFRDGRNVPLHVFLKQIARLFLVPCGWQAIPRLPDGGEQAAHGLAATAAARRAWRWLSFALPPDLLLAALGNGHAGPEEIELVSPPLDRHLREHGFAETHLHLGAALDFTQLWSLAMRAVADEDFKPDTFRAVGAGLAEGRELAGWLLRAAQTRYLLAAFLWQPGRPTSFRDWFQNVLCPRIVGEVGLGGCVLLQESLHELATGRQHLAPENFTALRMLYAQITGATVNRPITTRRQTLSADPVGRLFPAADPAGRSPEGCLVARALDHLQQANDPEFERVFWQAVRVRCLFYRHTVQRPLTPGLQWFVRFYGRSGPARRRMQLRAQLECAARLGGAGRGLRSLEFRTAPGRELRDLRAYLAAVDEVSREWAGARPAPDAEAAEPTEVDSGRGLELGVVFHFTKQRGGGADQGMPRAHWRGTHADPAPANGANPTGYRYAKFFRDKRAEAQALESLLTLWPLALELVRGVDVCTDELGVPTWVLAPILDRVRFAADEGAAALRQLTGRKVPPLRTTVHAGEDFVHLLGGLRRVDEAVEQLRLREGDRIGHGVALGVDSRDWAQRAGRMAVLSEERLLDLVWEWGCYGRQACAPVPGRLAYVEYEIARLTELVFGRTRRPREIERLQQQLCDHAALYAVGFPDGTTPATNSQLGSDLRFLRRYLTDPTWFDCGRKTVWVDPASEADTLTALQVALRKKVGARGLTVEVNPTSNLLIGDLSDLARHPMWRLRPPRGGGDAPPVAVCIGSDDPLVFASNLRQEYQFLNDAMLLAGLSEDEARGWLDRSRACGLEARFTLATTDRSRDRLMSVPNTPPARVNSLL